MISQSTLRELCTLKHGPCITIYGAMSNEDFKRGVALTNEARKRIEQNLDGYARPELIERMLEKLSTVEHLNRAAKHHWGYAIFARAGGLEYFQVPYAFTPSVVRGNIFDITQLLAAARLVGHYYILSLHKDSATLFRCDAFTERIVDRYDDIIIHGEDQQRERSMRSVGSHAGHGGSLISHADTERNEGHEILKYFTALDDHLSTLLHDDPAQIFVASQEREGSTFLRHTRNPKIREDLLKTILFDHDVTHVRELADSILEKDRKTELVHALEEYSFQLSRGATCRDLSAMREYADDGRIAILFIERGVELPEIHEIVRLSVLKHAEVYVLDPEVMPARGAAAILRY